VFRKQMQAGPVAGSWGRISSCLLQLHTTAQVPPACMQAPAPHICRSGAHGHFKS